MTAEAKTLTLEELCLELAEKHRGILSCRALAREMIRDYPDLVDAWVSNDLLSILTAHVSDLLRTHRQAQMKALQRRQSAGRSVSESLKLSAARAGERARDWLVQQALSVRLATREGDKAVHMRLGEMRRTHLLSTMAHYRQQANRELRIADGLQRLVDSLVSDDAQVSDLPDDVIRYVAEHHLSEGDLD